MAAEVKAPMSANNNKLLHAVLLKAEIQLISVQYKFTVNIMRMANPNKVKTSRVQLGRGEGDS